MYISIVPGQVSPWATGLIAYHRSFLLIHAVFALAEPNVTRLAVTFLTLFTDWMLYIQEEWDVLLASIRDGTILDIEHIEHVRDSLQVGLMKLSTSGGC